MGDVVGVIPARYGSERLPGKVLKKIGNCTILESVYRHAIKAKTLTRILIATDSDIIADEARRIGAQVVFTAPDCRSGSDRVALVARKIKGDIFVNIQADEPFIPAEAIDLPVKAMLDDDAIVCATAATRIRKESDLYNPHITKVVVNKQSFALFFSGSLIPFPRIYFSRDLPFFGRVVFLKHIGVYAFQRKFLLRFAKFPSTPLEQVEQLEQLRILENGYTIKVVVVAKDSQSVDTIDDIRTLNRQPNG